MNLSLPKEVWDACSIDNAIITHASIAIERGVLTFGLTLDYGGSGQVFGGYRLDGESAKHFCAELILRLMDCVGVERWEDLVGKSCRAIRDSVGIARGIGHIVKDKWVHVPSLVKELGI